ncbi:hypothetical protein C4572_02095 [Candidatus Parcubacteria bacterium]|nr:MAG: hypothetical protein C4572_02095 [Candidatus Parcubacteria bacterium]
MKSKIIIIAVIAAIGAGIWYAKAKNSPVGVGEISSFDECVAAGNPVMESYPAQCRTKDGRLFVQETEQPVIPEAVKIVKTYAAQQAKVNEDEVVIISFSEKEWSNACLGITSPGEMCAEVITPGYEVALLINGEESTYRTSNSGTLIKSL